ncbi:MAG: pitrilysin family protein [Wolbachia endosymbiont of Xenopsylla cheopis]
MLPKITTLENNLRIVTDFLPSVESVVLSLWVNVGSRFESEKNKGISHFLEHMAFKGTKARTALEIAKAFDDIGGNCNAHTGRENTVYYAKVLKNDVKIAIDILTDIIMNSTFPEDEIEREKGVVLQEIYRTNDSPSDIISDKYMETAYSRQSFGHSILGSPETVKAFSRENLFNYTQEYYYSDNMIFAVSGNISHDEVISLAGPILAKIKGKERCELQKSNYTGGEYLEIRDLEQVNILIGFPSISYYDDKYYTMLVLDSILGSGMSSRLFQEVREKQGLAYDVGSYHSTYRDTGIFSIYAGTDSNNLPKLLSTIAEELKKLLNDLKEEEITRAHAKIKSGILMSRESNYTRADVLGHCYSYHNRYLSAEEILDKIFSIGIKEVKENLEFLLSQYKNITVAAIGKLDKMPSYNKLVASFKLAN